MKTINKQYSFSWCKLICVSLLTTIISACGGGGSGTGADNEDQQASSSSTKSSITPMAEYLNQDGAELPRNADVQAFMTHFWNNVAETDRCGQCHDDTHADPFARRDNINDAYDATTGLINRAAPQSSALVSKVESGHQCWENSTSACAQILTRWIQNWVNAGGGNGESSTTIVLEKPDEIDLGSTKITPVDMPATFTAPGGLHEIFTDYCAGCHSETAPASIQPFFASSIAENAWDAARGFIDLQDENRSVQEAQSRFVSRLFADLHNCWDDCTDNASEVLTAIQTIADGVELQTIDPDLEVSGGMILTEGTVASSGGRYEQYQIAFWNFSEGDGSTAFDTSGVEPAMNLSIDSNITWVGGWGIDIGPNAGRAWANTDSSKKLFDNISLTGEYTVEAWVAPANVSQEEAHIISYSDGIESRNFTIGQTLYSYDFFQKTSLDSDGENNLSTDADDERLQATLQHVVLTYDRENGRRIYVNGEYTGDEDPIGTGYLTNWSDDYIFSIGNEATGNNQWEGMVRMAAIHNRALTADQVLQNYDVGVGQKYYLLFDITDLVDIDDCWNSYIVFEAAQLDNYAYRFNNPFFARLYEALPDNGSNPIECTATTPPDQDSYNFGISDIRIGINGKVAQIGQAFRNIGRDASGAEDPLAITTAANADGYQELANIGTTFAIENGPVADLFFLSFGSINGASGKVTEPAAISVENPILDEKPDFGLKTFEEINASMSEMTGIPTTNSSVVSVFDDVKTQLPTSELAETFLAAHQIGIAQLAITYCNELVNLEVSQAAVDRTFFGAVDLGAIPSVAFADATERDKVYDPIINMTINSALAAQPTTAEAKIRFDTLLDGYSDGGQSRSGLLDCGADCTATRTQTIVKSLCAASIGSATMLIQ